MWHVLLFDIRFLAYVPGSDIWQARLISRGFYKRSLSRLQAPVVLRDVPGPFGQQHLDHLSQVSRLMRLRGIPWPRTLLLGKGTFRLGSPLELHSLTLRGERETLLQGEIRVKGKCTIASCSIRGKNTHFSRPHSRQLLKVGVRLLPSAHLTLREVSISHVQGYGIFVGPDAELEAEGVVVRDSLLCNAYLDRRARVHFLRSYLHGVCWGIECMCGVHLHLDKTRVNHTGVYNVKVRETTTVRYTDI